MTPIVRYMLICDDVHPDAGKRMCTHIECLMSTIVSLENPPFPVLREQICVYLVLTDCYGRGTAQVKVVSVDDENELVCFGSAEHELDFRHHSPLEVLSVVFRIKDCEFPRAGRYSVQLWYNADMLAERPLHLKSPSP